MEIEKIIAQHLATNRRLTIPKLGTFIVKREEQGEAGTKIVTTDQSAQPTQELLFSEFMKGDDGVLRSLIVKSGASEIESAGAIDRLLFEIRHATDCIGGTYSIKGIGELVRESPDSLTFIAAKDALSLQEKQIEQTPTEPIEENAGEQSDTNEATTPTNSVNDLFESLNKEQMEREQSATLFTPSERAEAKRVTQSSRRIIDTLWIVVPTIAALFVLAFVGYVMMEQWRLGSLELPESIEKILIKIYEIIKQADGANNG